MAIIRITIIVLVTTVGAIARNASAQVGTTTGMIVGTVVDNTKAVIPGVTINVGGPAMMGVRTTVSGPDGGYRIPELAPGEYKVTFEVPGFGTVARESIIVTVGFTATVNVEMSPAGVAENVTVSGAGPIVDLASNRVTTTYNAEQMTTLPGSRDFWGVLAVSAPAVAVTKVDVGGNGALVEQGYSSYGLTTQNRGEVEGMVVTEGSGGGAAGEIYYVDFNSFDGMSVSPIGNTAEMPQPGVVTTLISKSGGNRYHADLYQDYQSKSVEAHNIDSSCHRTDLSGGEDGAPALRGDPFFLRWKGRSLSDLYFVIAETMPQDAPGSLSGTEYADVISFILKKNDAAAGESELLPDMERLKHVMLTERPVR